MTELLSVVLVSRIFFKRKIQRNILHIYVINYYFTIANVNDRSQAGDADSEIAAVIEDKDYINSKMAGKDVFVFYILNSNLLLVLKGCLF